MHPFIYMYCYNVTTCLFFAPSLKKLPLQTIACEWRRNRWRITGVAFFNTFSYVLMLFALSMSKVTYVGALRQLSLVFGVTLGWLFLKETLNGTRIAGLILIIVGACLTYLAD
jgi:drug/metabolite transporter (DMT)-like permease